MSLFEGVPPLGPDAPWRETLSEMPAAASARDYGNTPVLESPFATASLTDRGPAPARPRRQAASNRPSAAGMSPSGRPSANRKRSTRCWRNSKTSSSTKRSPGWSMRPQACISGSGATWSSSEAAPAWRAAELEGWIQPLRQETHRMLDNMADRLGAEELETLREPELEAVFESLAPELASCRRRSRTSSAASSTRRKSSSRARFRHRQARRLPLRFVLGEVLQG